jgi:mono/diheme cytochrome c family protein
VTEIPEHLLRRSRERRAALSGGDAGEGEAAAPAPAASAPAESSEAASAETAPVPAAAPAPAPAVIDEPLAPVYIADAAAKRSRIPIWAAPVLVILPLWAVLYAGAFGTRGKTGPVDPLVLGQQVYASAGCSSCHGGSGEGGVGPPLHGGQAKLTFPNEADHIKWVQTGSGPYAGKPYGDPARPGGQHVAKGIMPSFSGALSQAQIEAVVKYEREKL